MARVDVNPRDFVGAEPLGYYPLYFGLLSLRIWLLAALRLHTATLLQPRNTVQPWLHLTKQRDLRAQGHRDHSVIATLIAGSSLAPCRKRCFLFQVWLAMRYDARMMVMKTVPFQGPWTTTRFNFTCCRGANWKTGTTTRGFTSGRT